MLLTTANVGHYISMDARNVANLCKDRLLYAEKKADKDGLFPYWHISDLSLAYYLRYNKEARQTFEKGEETMLQSKVKKLMNDLSCEKKVYTLAQTATILGVKKLDVVKKCLHGELSRRHILMRTFTLTDILLYIKNTKGAEESLNTRYENALVNCTMDLMILREVVTAYAYFKQYGYAL